MTIELKETQKIYILIGIFAAMALVLYYSFLLKPQLSGFISANREYAALKTKVKNEEALIANEPAIRRQYAIAKEQAAYLEKRLPSQDKISSLLEQFSSIAESSGVKILKLKPIEDSNITPKPQGTSIIYYEYPIVIDAKAGYHQLGDFINKLENMDRFIRAMDVDIKGNDKDPRHHDIRLKIVTYVLQ